MRTLCALPLIVYVIGIYQALRRIREGLGSNLCFGRVFETSEKAIGARDQQ